ncbi:MAG TPA: DedA family protein [Phycisphaerae bacterium]|nr:DedA family protein [Phycisphaerae bacterium]
MFYENWTYLGVLVVLLAAGLGVPIPEDVPLLTGGYLCYAGYANVVIMIFVGMAGVLTGDIMLFSIGRKLGHDVLRRRSLRRMVNPGRLILAERLFAKHGVKIIFAGRFLPGLRPMIFMAAGVLKVPFSMFILVNGLAACISVPTLILLGRFFGYKLEAVKTEVHEVTHVLVVCVAVAALVTAGFYLHHRQKKVLAKAHLGGREMLLEVVPGPKSDTADSDRAGDTIQRLSKKSA